MGESRSGEGPPSLTKQSRARAHAPDVRSWDPDIEGLVEAISRGELDSRISAEVGDHEAQPSSLRW